MKYLISLLVILSVSGGWASPGHNNDPTPFPLGQAPADFIGQWNNPQKGETIVITHLTARKKTREKLFVEIFQNNRRDSQGFLYFEANQFCGSMRRVRGASYNLCIWKEDRLLKTAVYSDGEWSLVSQYR